MAGDQLPNPADLPNARAQRERFGDLADRVDEAIFAPWAERFGDLDADAVVALLEHLRQRIRAINVALDELYDTRRAIFIDCLEAGTMKKTELAKASGLSPMAVTHALTPELRARVGR